MKRVELGLFTAVYLSLLAMIAYTLAGFFGDNPEIHSIRYQALSFSITFALVLTLMNVSYESQKYSAERDVGLVQS